jgi:hypothetical protein
MLHAFLKSAIYQIFNPIYCVCAMGKQASFVLCLFLFFLYYFVDDGLFVRVQVQEKVLLTAHSFLLNLHSLEKATVH